MVEEQAVHKRGKGERTKQKLIESAELLFNQHDFDDVSVDSIVEAAGVAKGTFYVYFESKDELIASFLIDYVRGVDADYQAHLDTLPQDISASDMLLSFIGKISDTLTEGIGYQRMRIVYRMLLGGNIEMNPVKDYNRALYKIFSDVLQRGFQRGEFQAELSPDLLAKHLTTAIRGISYEWCIRYPELNLKEQALAHFRLLLDGLRLRG